MKRIQINNKVSFDELVNIISENSDIVIEFSPVSLYNQEIIYKLQEKFEDLAIHGIKWIGNLIVVKGISNKLILDNKTEFLLLIKKYTNKGLSLVENLYNTFEIERGEGDYSKLSKKLKLLKSYPLVPLENNWTCRIHGGDYGFKNTQTKQIIEVWISNYLKLNSWSLKEYLVNSNEFETLKELVDNKQSNILKAMDILFLNGYLEEGSDFTNNHLKLKKEYL